MLQKRLTKDHCTNKPVNAGSNLDDKLFILYVEESPDSFKHKKTNEAIESLVCPSLGIIYGINKLPPFFEDICYGNQDGVNNIISLYRKNYSNLLAAAKAIRTAEAGEESEVESQSDEE